MGNDVGYFLSIRDGEHGDTEAFIRAALGHDMILKWAYILQDKEYYTQSDISARRSGLEYNWATGFMGQEKYASCESYIEKMMNEPPFVGDRKNSWWRIVCITDKNCMFEDIETWFEICQSPYADFLDGRVRIVEELKWILNENKLNVSREYHHYSDDEVRANFDFREYMENTVDPRKAHPRWEHFKDVMRPAPLRPRRRKYLTRADFEKKDTEDK